MTTEVRCHRLAARVALIIDGKRIRTGAFTVKLSDRPSPMTDGWIFILRSSRKYTITWTDSGGDHAVKARIVMYPVRRSGRNILIYSTQEG